MNLSEDDEFDVVQPTTGTLRRVAIVVLVLAAAAAVIWRLWPDHGRGEREQAHRVLIVGGTPTDLSAAIAEAGFEGVQKTWGDAEAEVTALEQRFDLDALIGYADEHGYGFVAVIFGDDYPWSPTLLGVDAPEHAGAAVISIGELALDATPQVTFGGPPHELEYAPGIERTEALRLALYHHPDLVRLWDDPTPDQQAQQVHLARLADMRLLLDLQSERYAAALKAWPKLPSDAIAGRWDNVSGFAVAGGVIVEVVPSRLQVNERREVVRVHDPPTTKFISDAALAGPDPLAHASTVEVAELHSVELSSDRRWFAGADRDTSDMRRYEVTPTGIVDLGLNGREGTPMAISNSGRIADWSPSLIFTDVGNLEFDFDHVNVRIGAWYHDERLGLAVTAASEANPDTWAPYLLLVQPVADPLVTPPMLALRPDSLLAAGSFVPGTATVSDLFATSAGLFVIVHHHNLDRDELRTVLRLTIPDHALAQIPVDQEFSPRLTGELLQAMLSEPDDLEVVTLGIIPFTEELDVAPDGSWIAWRATGRRQTVRAAPIENDSIGVAIEIDDGSNRKLRSHPGPWFRADSQALLFADVLATGLSNNDEDDYYYDPWVAEYLRVVPLK